jgi:hypothetical protein
LNSSITLLMGRKWVYLPDVVGNKSKSGHETAQMMRVEQVRENKFKYVAVSI